MAIKYKSKYCGDLYWYVKEGWTEEEIDQHFPVLESMTNKELLRIHEMCEIKMYSDEERVDKEQAVIVLVNPMDTPKELLISSIKALQLDKKELKY